MSSPRRDVEEKKMEKKKKTEKETQRGRDRERAVPITAAKGLSGIFSSHGVILIKPWSCDSLVLSHGKRESTGR